MPDRRVFQLDLAAVHDRPGGRLITAGDKAQLRRGPADGRDPTAAAEEPT